ncbi:MAG TPA: hypothetical protein VMT52_00870 [Planctomycetota bacterium]|nr:hypothetical protein [Planctomycetota bacterium]
MCTFLTAALLLGYSLAGDADPRARPEDPPEVLLEEAYYREVALADPEGAMEMYRKLIETPGVEARVAARARIRLGICHHLRGETQLANEQFQTVVDTYPRETEALKTALRHLGQPAPGDPSVFMPEDTLFFVEIVDPRQHLRALSSLLEGTPFQNPVSYSVSYLDRRASPPVVQDAAAFLNEGFLRELQKIESVGYSIPGDRAGGGEFVAALVPGSSDIIPGLVQMGLTLSGSSTPVGSVRDLPIFRLPPPRDLAGASLDEHVHMAFGPGVLVLGRPRRHVEEAIERRSRTRPSLADSEEFQRARAAREGRMVFSHVGVPRALDLLRENLPAGDRPGFDALRGVLGWDRLHATSITLSRSSPADSLKLSFRAEVRTEDLDAWDALATPPLGPRLLDAIPAASLAFFATRFDRARDRVEAMWRAYGKLLDSLEHDPEKRAKALEDLEALYALLLDGPGGELLDLLDGVAFGLGPDLALPLSESLFFAVELKETDAGERAIEAALTKVFSHYLDNAASREFRREVLEDGGRTLHVRSIEPIPSWRLRIARIGDVFVLSASGKLILEAAAAHQSGRTARAEPIPEGSAKIVFLRLAAILERLGGRADMPERLKLILREVPRVLLSTREGKQSISAEILIPEVTPTTRGILNHVAGALAEGRRDREEIEKAKKEAAAEKRGDGKEE